MKNQTLFLTACTAVLLSSCTSLRSYTDAKTQEKGTIRSFVGDGQTVGPEALINETLETASDLSGVGTTAEGTIVEAGARVGITEKLMPGSSILFLVEYL